MTIEEAIKQLEERMGVLVLYLGTKSREHDWHGVADAAMDLRDTESEIKGLQLAVLLLKENKGL